MEYKGIEHNKVNLFFNYYKDELRQHEIDQCLRLNKLLFDRVIIVEGKPTFSELFSLSKDYPNDINCFCNSDIYFTDLSRIKKIRENEGYAITRDDMVNTTNASCSQDAWAFRGVVKKMNAHFTMGLWGCDNRIANEIKQAGYILKNPSLSIKIVHLHKVDNRQHHRTNENTLPPPYQLIAPSL